VKYIYNNVQVGSGIVRRKTSEITNLNGAVLRMTKQTKCLYIFNMNKNKYIRIAAGLITLSIGYIAAAWLAAKFINLVNYFM